MFVEHLMIIVVKLFRVTLLSMEQMFIAKTSISLFPPLSLHLFLLLRSMYPFYPSLSLQLSLPLPISPSLRLTHLFHCLPFQQIVPSVSLSLSTFLLCNSILSFAQLSPTMYCPPCFSIFSISCPL